ncbi:uncharacterized protein LOC104846745 isoform X2 [Loxodonta africana]|uniref:uncharacterized protein LOC126086775 isoform X2 n=2 Tax=Elephantidae TaxID=9780 RepID=UPI0021161BD8|nr:uncharacterized protein LOC126086775 isoform X2 [Elephas maximus indicus]
MTAREWSRAGLLLCAPLVVGGLGPRLHSNLFHLLKRLALGSLPSRRDLEGGGGEEGTGHAGKMTPTFGSRTFNTSPDNGPAESSQTPRGMASTPTKNEEKKGSRPTQAASSLGGGQASLSRSEEFLTRISTELTDEALFIAGCHMNPVPTKEKQTQDQGTQISKHVFITKTRGTDTRSDRNRTRTKAHLLPSPREKGPLPSNLTSGG